MLLSRRAKTIASEAISRFQGFNSDLLLTVLSPEIRDKFFEIVAPHGSDRFEINLEIIIGRERFTSSAKLSISGAVGSAAPYDHIEAVRLGSIINAGATLIMVQYLFEALKKYNFPTMVELKSQCDISGHRAVLLTRIPIIEFLS